MDFPIYLNDFFGNRLLMAFIAILHVVVSHIFAVGGFVLLFGLEFLAFKKNNIALDDFLKKVAKIIFVITSTVGALSGAGIWFTSTIIAPYGIGRLLRVFFPVWALEWFVFIVELLVTLFYVLWWPSLKDKRAKKKHLVIGFSLAFLSWLTMVIISAILGFMMQPIAMDGSEFTIANAYFGSLYLPQLGFRTAFSMLAGGLLLQLFSRILKPQKEVVFFLSEKLSLWNVGWTLVLLVTGYWYWQVVPSVAKSLLSVALTTNQFIAHQEKYLYCLLGLGLFIFIGNLIGCFVKKIATFMIVLMLFSSIYLLGTFERVREFLRKPYILNGYLYSNGIAKRELAFFQEKGILSYASFSSVKEVTDENKVQAGKEVFELTCSQCHTLNNVNSLEKVFNELGPKSFRRQLDHLHSIYAYMPPFPGNAVEADALVAFMQSLSGEKKV